MSLEIPVSAMIHAFAECVVCAKAAPPDAKRQGWMMALIPATNMSVLTRRETRDTTLRDVKVVVAYCSEHAPMSREEYEFALRGQRRKRP